MDFLKFLIGLTFLSSLQVCNCYPDYLSCSTSLSVGTRIMGSNVQSSTQRSAIVMRGSTQLSNGASYFPSETLSLTLTDSSGQFIFQISSGSFANGICSNLRIIPSGSNSVTVIMPSTGSVTIKIAWASSQSTVRTKDFILYPAPSTTAITAAPTLVPLAVPTTIPTVTRVPSYLPSGPSIMPSYFATTPSAKPTVSVTANPSATPSLSPTNASVPSETTASASLIDYPENTPVKLAVGLIVGTLGALALFASIAFYLRSLRSGDIAWISLLLRLPVSSVSALLLSCAAIGLVSAWAQNGNTDSETGFLGSPNWRDNTLAWHVLLMVGGFFCAQVVAVCCWSLFPAPSHPTPCSLPKAMHVLLQVAAMSAMVAGLYAIVRHMVSSKAPSLTTMHSWVGVASIAVYGVAMLWGAGMASLTAWHPSSFLREAFDLRLLHKMIGLTSVALSAMAVVTGIDNQLGQGACNYIGYQYGVYKADADPAGNYHSLPQACRIANGLGVCVLLATISMFIAVGLRNYSPLIVDSETSQTKAFKPVEDFECGVADSQVVGREGSACWCCSTPLLYHDHHFPILQIPTVAIAI